MKNESINENLLTNSDKKVNELIMGNDLKKTDPNLDSIKKQLHSKIDKIDIKSTSKPIGTQFMNISIKQNSKVISNTKIDYNSKH